MSQLKFKSEQNLKAAELLLRQENSFFAPSIHCCYYSCLQYIFYTIVEHLGRTQNNLAAELRDKQRYNRIGSHQYAINIIKTELHKDPDRQVFKTFQKDIGELKELREFADYSGDEVLIDKGLKAQSLARSILSILKSRFK